MKIQIRDKIPKFRNCFIIEIMKKDSNEKVKMFKIEIKDGKDAKYLLEQYLITLYALKEGNTNYDKLKMFKFIKPHIHRRSGEEKVDVYDKIIGFKVYYYDREFNGYNVKCNL